MYIVCTYALVKRVQHLNLNKNDGLDIALALMVGGLIGARLMHVFYESPAYYQGSPLEVFKVWKGGFVFYGGAIGSFASCLAVIKIKKLSYRQWADVFAPLAAIGYAFGRLGCFFNGCCFGRLCDLPWAVELPNFPGARHPTQIYAFLFEVCIFAALIYFDKTRDKKNTALHLWMRPKGQLFHFWLVFHSLNRLLMESFRADYRGAFIFNLSISTWISLIILLTAGHFLFHDGRRAKPSPTKKC